MATENNRDNLSTTSEVEPSANATQTPESNAITFYGKMLTFSRIRFETDNHAHIEATLDKLLTHKNSKIPVVIESDIEQDLPKLVELLWSWGLQPIGVVDGMLTEKAQHMRLAIFPSDGKRIKNLPPTIDKVSVKSTEVVTTAHDSVANPQNPVDKNKTPDQSTSEHNVINTEVNTTTEEIEVDLDNDSLSEIDDVQIHDKVYNQMLRSGQSINHVGGDLILTNSINNGAEVITDNSLHIYGRANGRLVAGATGDRHARIFCQIFNPSLVSVAGTYCLRDSIPAEVIDKPVQVSFDNEGNGLKFEIMNNM